MNRTTALRIGAKPLDLRDPYYRPQARRAYNEAMAWVASATTCLDNSCDKFRCVAQDDLHRANDYLASVLHRYGAENCK
jgi:hypothetical protein